MVGTDLRLLNTCVSELTSQYKVRSNAFAVCVFEVFRSNDALSVDRIRSGKRNPILEARLRNIRIEDSEIANNLRIRIRKNGNGNPEASREIDYDFGTVVRDDGDTETKTLIFRERLSQLDQLGLAPGSPVDGTIKEQYQPLRSSE
jgi:hypothetical protein